MDRLEILIDKLLFYVPTDLPFLASLMMRAGRALYHFRFCCCGRIVAGLAVVAAVADDVC